HTTAALRSSERLETERLQRRAQRRGCWRRREARENRGLDAGRVETAFGEELLAARVLEVGIGEAEVQERDRDACGSERFGHARARAAHDRVVLERDEALVRARD